jgi:O-antigen ligase
MIWLLIGYMFLFIHRPFEVWPVLAAVRLERVYMVATLAFAALAPGKRWLPNAQHFAHLGFSAAVFLCWIASPWADKGEEVVENYFKILVFYFLLVSLIHDEGSLKRIVLALLCITFIYMSHSLWEYVNGRHTFRMGIPRLVGVDSSLGDPNSFGASILYTLPFVTPFWLGQPSRKVRLFLIAFVALSFVCIGLTGSRGSFVGLLVWVLVMVLRSRWRWRLLGLSVLAAPLLFAALPGSLQTRFETIINPEVGPKNAQGSALSRLEGLMKGVELWQKNPLTGCGPGAFRPATGSLLESHNLYGQVLGETGSLGAITFVLVLVAFAVNLRRIWLAYRRHPEWERDFPYQLANALALALFMMLFEGNFGHNLFRYSWLWYGGIVIITWHCVQQREARAMQRRASVRMLRPRYLVPALGRRASPA